MNIWDVGGQKSIRAFWRNYFDTTDGLAWVVDSSDIHRLNDCKIELHKLLSEDRLSGASLLVIANKQDVPGAVNPKEISKLLNIEEISQKRHCAIFACSAFDPKSVSNSMNWLIRDIGNRIYSVR